MDKKRFWAYLLTIVIIAQSLVVHPVNIGLAQEELDTVESSVDDTEDMNEEDSYDQDQVLEDGDTLDETEIDGEVIDQNKDSTIKDEKETTGKDEVPVMEEEEEEAEEVPAQEANIEDGKDEEERETIPPSTAGPIFTGPRPILRQSLETSLKKGRIGKDHPTKEGDVMIYKEAERVAGKVNTWDVTLRVEAMPVNKTADIVLVIDRSGSMDDGGDGSGKTRMDLAKEAAKNFVDNLLPSDNIKIGLVSYSTKYSTSNLVEKNSELTNEKSDLNSAIDGLIALGGTNTQAGLYEAREMLKNSKADYKHIVLISDGEPTQSYDLKESSIDNSDFWKKIVDRLYEPIRDKYLESYMDYGKLLGNGYVQDTNKPYEFTKGWPFNRETYRYTIVDQTIGESTIAKNRGIEVYTLGVDMPPAGKETMKDIASSADHAFDTAGAEIDKHLDEIRKKVDPQVIKDVVIKDKMATGMKIKPDNNSSNPGVTIAEDGKSLTWKFDKLTKKIKIDEDKDVYYDEFTYRVEIDEDILGAEGQTILNSPDKLFDTNKKATISYTDINNKREEDKLFPKPKVDPIIYGLKKTILSPEKTILSPEEDKKIKSNDKFKVNIQNDSIAPNDSKTIEADGEIHYFTDLREQGNYTFSEVTDENHDNIYEPPKYILWKRENSESEWEKVNDETVGEISRVEEISRFVSKESEKSFHDGNSYEKLTDSKDHKDFYVEIINKEKPISLNLEKKWLDEKGNPTEDGADSIQFILKRKVGQEEDKAFEKKVSLEKTKDWKAIVENLARRNEKGEFYKYYVEEETVEGYIKVDNKGNEKDFYQVKAEDFGEIEPALTLTNKLKDVNLTIIKDWEMTNNEAKKPKEVSLTIYKDGKPFGDKVSLTESEDWKAELKNLPLGSYQDGKFINHEYSVKEDKVNGFTPIYGEPNYNEAENTWEIKITNKEITYPITGSTGAGPLVALGLFLTLSGVLLNKKRKLSI